MICITNARTDRIALIVHCAHEHIADFRRDYGMEKKVFTVFPVYGMGYSNTPTHYEMEPSALEVFETWAKEIGFSVSRV